MSLSDSAVDRIRSNLKDVERHIAISRERSPRAAAGVRMIAVTKYAGIDRVRALLENGIQDLGESRVQQLMERVPQLPGSVTWHLIGQLQRNKVRAVLPLVSLIHSVASVRLLDQIRRTAAESGSPPELLLEVNISGESTKGGFSPEDLVSASSQLSAATDVSIQGLMTMAPRVDDPEQVRPVFRRLAELRHRLSDSTGLALPELSMGMSEDFEVAIEEGATMVRLGNRLFEGLAEDD